MKIGVLWTNFEDWDIARIVAADTLEDARAKLMKWSAAFVGDEPEVRRYQGTSDCHDCYLWRVDTTGSSFGDHYYWRLTIEQVSE